MADRERERGLLGGAVWPPSATHREGSLRAPVSKSSWNQQARPVGMVGSLQPVGHGLLGLPRQTAPHLVAENETLFSHPSGGQRSDTRASMLPPKAPWGACPCLWRLRDPGPLGSGPHHCSLCLRLHAFPLRLRSSLGIANEDTRYQLWAIRESRRIS